MSGRGSPLVLRFTLLGSGILIGLVLAGWLWQPGLAQAPKAPALLTPPVNKANNLMPDTAAGSISDWERPYPQYQPAGKVLKQFPACQPGDIMPQDLYRHTGRGTTSFASVDDVKDFEEFCQQCSERKAQVMAERARYLEQRYDFTRKVTTEATMTRGKPLPVGPVVRLPKGVTSWDELAAIPANVIVERNLFPEGFRPLSHPLHSTGHQLFPQFWTRLHPEHERFDVDFDLPDTYLPEFPPPLFLTTRPDLGDVSRGHEITQANFRDIFDGILTPEQLEGARLMVTKFPTSWFNQTKHRVTRQPTRGTACRKADWLAVRPK